MPALFPSLLPMSFRKSYFCQSLRGVIIPFSSIYKGKTSLPMLPSLPSASYPSRILMQKAWLLDADCNVTWCRLQCNLTQITAWFASSWKLIWHRLECDMLQIAQVFLSFSIKIFNFVTMNLDSIITYSVSARGGFLYLRWIQSIQIIVRYRHYCWILQCFFDVHHNFLN